MKIKTVAIFLLFIYSSCTVTKKSSLQIKISDGQTYYEEVSTPIRFKLYDDYLFQPLKTKYYRDVDKRFIKYITDKYHNVTPKIIYKAHTIIQPFYSTVCLQYKTNLLDTLSLKEIKIQLKSQLHANSSKPEKIRCGSREVYKIKYQTTNAVNKIYSSHTEYFFKNGGFIYRLFFWTIDADDKIISSEAEKIIKNIRFE